jgi:hypothetical protein
MLMMTFVAVLYEKSLFIVFGADDLGNLRNDFFVLDITNWQWVSDFKVDGNYPAPLPSASTNNNPASSSVVNSNSKSSASTTTTDQAFISINYMKPIYLIISIMIFFTFL